MVCMEGGDTQEYELSQDVPSTQNTDDDGDPLYSLVPHMPIDFKKEYFEDDDKTRLTKIGQVLNAMQAGKLVKQTNDFVNRGGADVGSVIGGIKQFLCGFYLEFPDAYTRYIDKLRKGEDDYMLLKPGVAMRYDTVPVPTADEVAYNVVTDAEFLRRELDVDNDGRPWRNKRGDWYIFKVTEGQPLFHKIDDSDYRTEWYDSNDWSLRGVEPAVLYKKIVFRRFQLIPYILNKMMGEDWHRPEYMDETGAPTLECIIRNQLRAVKVGMTSWSSNHPTHSLSNRLAQYGQQGKTFYSAFAANVRVFMRREAPEWKEVPYTWCDRHLKKQICELYEGKLHNMFFKSAFMVSGKPESIRDYFDQVKIGQVSGVYEDALLHRHPKKEEVLYIDGNAAPDWIFRNAVKMFEVNQERLNLLRYGGHSFKKRLEEDRFGKDNKDFDKKIKDFIQEVKTCQEAPYKFPPPWPEKKNDTLYDRSFVVDENTTEKMTNDPQYKQQVEDARGPMTLDEDTGLMVSAKGLVHTKMTPREWREWNEFNVRNIPDFKNNLLEKKKLLNQNVFKDTEIVVFMDGWQSVQNSLIMDVPRLVNDSLLKDKTWKTYVKTYSDTFEKAITSKKGKSVVLYPEDAGGVRIRPESIGGGPAGKGKEHKRPGKDGPNKKVSRRKTVVELEDQLEKMKLRF